MVDRVLAAVRSSSIEDVIVAVSPHTPETAEHVAAETVETPGAGYVPDLSIALEEVGRPALTVAADLPLLTGALVDRVRRLSGGQTTAVYVPLSIAERVQASVDTTAEIEGRQVVPTGVNVVGASEEDRSLVLSDPRLAANVNRPDDRRRAEGLA